MTLDAYLDTLHSDPADPATPMLLWFDGDAPANLIDLLDAGGYANRPYVIALGLPMGGAAALHDRRSRVTGGIDFLIRQRPDADMQLPDAGNCSRVMAAILNARRVVTHLTSDYALLNGLTLTTEIPPERLDGDRYRGWQGVLRFSYQLIR